MPAKSRSLLRLAICALFALCFLGHASHPPLADEIDFLLPLERWITQGPQRAGLWHSPLYPWLLSLLGRAFSLKPLVFRTVGLASTLLTALLLVAAARLKKTSWRFELLLALGLLSPIALGSALTLDYDTTLLVPATALYFLLLLRIEDDCPLHLSLVFGAALALCLLCKETTPLVYPLGFVVAFRNRLGLGRAAAAAAASLAIGLALFLLAAWLWCLVYGLPLGAVFEMDTLGLKIHGAGHGAGQALARALWVKVTPLFWLGLPMAALFAARLPWIFRRRSRDSNADAVAGVAVVVLAVAAAYTFGLRQMTYHFPKYMAPVLPWVGWLAVTQSPAAEGKTRAPWGWATGIVLWSLLAWDPLQILYERNLHGLALNLFVTGLPVVFWLGARVVGWKAPRASELAALLGLGLAASYSCEALFSAKSITYWYGDHALLAARPLLESWRSANPRGRILLPAKDLAYLGRDLGGLYTPRDALAGRGAELCADPSPLLILTRAREDSSLSQTPDLADVRKCLGMVIQDGDLVYGQVHATRPSR